MNQESYENSFGYQNLFQTVKSKAGWVESILPNVKYKTSPCVSLQVETMENNESDIEKQ